MGLSHDLKLRVRLCVRMCVCASVFVFVCVEVRDVCDYVLFHVLCCVCVNFAAQVLRRIGVSVNIYPYTCDDSTSNRTKKIPVYF